MVKVTPLTTAGAMCGLVYVVVVDPHVAGGYPVCPTRALAGLTCPGCGTLRALHDALHGRLASAFALNALAVVCTPLLFWWLADQIWHAVRGARLPRWNMPPAVAWGALAVVILWGVVRSVIPALAPA